MSFVQGQRIVSLMELIWYHKLPHTSRPPHSTPHSFRMTVKQWEPGQQTGSRSWMFPFTCFTVPSLALSKRNTRTSRAYYRQIGVPSVQIKFRTAINDSSNYPLQKERSVLAPSARHQPQTHICMQKNTSENLYFSITYPRIRWQTELWFGASSAV